MLRYVPGIGNREPLLMIIGEAPGKHEEDQLLPFVGPSGILLDKICSTIGQSDWRSKTYITNVVKYKPPDNDFGRIEELGIKLSDCVNDLYQEIYAFKPNMLLILGKNAMRAMGINGKLDEQRGSIRRGFGCKYLVSYHPARFLYGKETGEAQWKPYEKALLQHDIARAFKESETKDYNPPNRQLSVAEDSFQVMRFLDKWLPKSDRLARDIESINFVPFCESFCFHPSESISIPLFDGPLGKTRSRKDLARIWLMINKVDNNSRIKQVGQNWKYDEPKRRLLGLKFPKLYSDTLLKGHVACPEFPKNLALLTSLHTREPFYKNDYDDFKAGKTSIQEFMIYNARDAAVTLEIDSSLENDLSELGLLNFYYEFEMQLHYLYSELEENGIAWSEDVRAELIDTWTIKQAKNEIELYRITGMHLNCASPQQVKLCCIENLKLPPRAGYGEDSLVALMANNCKKPEQVRALELILENRRIRRLLSTTLASPTDYDGRMRTSVFIPATETRRTADYLLDSPIRPVSCGIGFKTLSKHGESGDIRRALIPDKGYVFLNFDQSQAEARVCSLLADDEVALADFDTIDAHAKMASIVFGGKIEKYDKKILGYECDERFIGKTMRHACNLDMLKKTAMQTVNTGAKKAGIDLVISEYKAGLYLEKIHGNNPKIKGVFHKSIQDALIEQDFFLTGSSPCIGRDWFPKRQFFGDYDREMWKEAYSFIPQQTVTDKTKWILLQIRDEYKNRDVKIVGESHDAGLLLVLEREIYNAAAFIKEVGHQAIDFSRCSIPRRNLIIPIDIEIGLDNYKDLKKFKPEIKGSIVYGVTI